MLPTAGRTDGSVLPTHPHLDELDALADDPHPRKTRRIEWVGERSPLDDPVVAFRLATKQFTPTQERVVRLAAVRARTRVRRERVLEHDHQYAMAVVKGLHRTYHWTAENGFVCDVDYADVDRILGDPTIGHEFRDLDALDADEPEPPAQLVPDVELVLVSEQAVSSNDALAGAVLARTGSGAVGRRHPARVW